MTSQFLQLRGHFLKLQRTAAKSYSQLQQRFAGNILVSESWAAMGNDLQAQAESLKKLPPSFWLSLKKQEKELVRAAELIQAQDSIKPTGSLQACMGQTLDLENPMILTVYAPLIRRLRGDWTERALDFYVMVKAHIARLSRLIQMYSGDPALIFRCAILFQNFEKEVQVPAIVEARYTPAAGKASSAKAAAKPKAVRRAQPKKAAEPARPVTKLSKRAKPLVKKIEIQRRRARR